MKYFGGVQTMTGQAANYTTDVAGKLYTSAKQYVPERAQPTVKAVEDKVSEYGSPVLTTIQDKGGKMLQVADSKVRSLHNMLSIWQIYCKRQMRRNCQSRRV